MAGQQTGLEAARWFGDTAAALQSTIEYAVVDALDELIVQLQAVTPVRSHHMQEDYAIGTGSGGYWELLNTAANPEDGYEYPARVLNDSTWSRQYGALKRTLDAGIDQIALSVDLSLSRLIRRPF